MHWKMLRFWTNAHSQVHRRGLNLSVTALSSMAEKWNTEVNTSCDSSHTHRLTMRSIAIKTRWICLLIRLKLHVKGLNTWVAYSYRVSGSFPLSATTCRWRIRPQNSKSSRQFTVVGTSTATTFRAYFWHSPFIVDSYYHSCAFKKKKNWKKPRKIVQDRRFRNDQSLCQMLFF